jgi:light-harvesting protein B-800-850 alpha chain
MIYGKLWCVVKPSTGIPLFLTAVAVSSFAVHVALLLTTSWLKGYYEGKPPGKAAAIESSEKVAAVLPPLVALKQ